MQKGLLGGILTLLLITGLIILVSCSKKAVHSTAVGAKPLTTEGDDMKVIDTERARLEAERRALEEEANRKIEDAVRDMFISEDIYFDFNDSLLTTNAQEILRQKAAWMRNNPEAHVVVEGHCDERGTAEYNLALGNQRAASAKDFLRDLGLPTSQIRTISYGEEKPIDKGSNEDAWAKNRRVHFEIE